MSRADIVFRSRDDVVRECLEAGLAPVVWTCPRCEHRMRRWAEPGAVLPVPTCGGWKVEHAECAMLPIDTEPRPPSEDDHDPYK